MTAGFAFFQKHLAQRGAINIAEFMQLALQHPEFGYYRHGDPIGHGGDFLTAPEISQMFGELLGLWCVETWWKMGSPSAFVWLEMGPGHGTLMQDALRATAKVAGFHQAMRLHFLECSETLREKQMQKVTPHKPNYIANLADLPALPVLTIANEFFDALPIRQFEKCFTGWCERLVTVSGDKLAFILSAPDEAVLLLIPEAVRGANPGAVLEISPASVNAMRDLAKHIATHGGAALIVDYGYTEPDGKPTLQAVKGHKYTDVLANVGDADITALVDFGMLRGAAEKYGVRAHGPLAQGDFLKVLGIELRADQLKRRSTPEQAAVLDVSLKRLTDPAEMGHLFKVLAVSAPHLSELSGF